MDSEQTKFHTHPQWTQAASAFGNREWWEHIHDADDLPNADWRLVVMLEGSDKLQLTSAADLSSCPLQFPAPQFHFVRPKIFVSPEQGAISCPTI